MGCDTYEYGPIDAGEDEYRRKIWGRGDTHDGVQVRALVEIAWELHQTNKNLEELDKSIQAVAEARR